MLGLRGCRLGVVIPVLVEMQARAVGNFPIDPFANPTYLQLPLSHHSHSLHSHSHRKTFCQTEQQAHCSPDCHPDLPAYCDPFNLFHRNSYYQPDHCCPYCYPNLPSYCHPFILSNCPHLSPPNLLAHCCPYLPTSTPTAFISPSSSTVPPTSLPSVNPTYPLSQTPNATPTFYPSANPTYLLSALTSLFFSPHSL